MRVRSKHVPYSSSAKVTRGVWVLIAALVLGVWVPTLSYMGWRTWRDSRPDVLPCIDLASGQNFSYNVERLKPQQAALFTYPAGSERVRFVLRRDSSGTIRTVVGSCIACYSSRQGHEFKDGQFICFRCRHAMRLGDQNEKLTAAKGCVAIPVPFSAEGGLVTVRAADMEERLRDPQEEATD